MTPSVARRSAIRGRYRTEVLRGAHPRMIPGAAYHPTAITGSFTAATAGERSAD